MPVPVLLHCDGCGQLADPSHISRRLQRLSWTSRYRPVHIQSLLLGAIAPKSDSEFLYAGPPAFEGEALNILKAAQILTEGKTPATALSEFQKLGLMLTHALECPLDESLSPQQVDALLEQHLPAVVSRIRRSLKPKRILLISSGWQRLADNLRQTSLDCPILPSPAGAFLPNLSPGESDFQALQVALAGASANAL